MQMASENQGESPPAGGAFQDTVRVAARAGMLKRTAVSRARPYVLAVVAAGVWATRRTRRRREEDRLLAAS